MTTYYLTHSRTPRKRKLTEFGVVNYPLPFTIEAKNHRTAVRIFSEQLYNSENYDWIEVDFRIYVASDAEFKHWLRYNVRVQPVLKVKMELEIKDEG